MPAAVACASTPTRRRAPSSTAAVTNWRRSWRIRLDLLKEKRSLVHHDIGDHAEKEDTLLAVGHRLGDSLGELERWLAHRQPAARTAA